MPGFWEFVRTPQWKYVSTFLLILAIIVGLVLYLGFRAVSASREIDDVMEEFSSAYSRGENFDPRGAADYISSVDKELLRFTLSMSAAVVIGLGLIGLAVFVGLATLVNPDLPLGILRKKRNEK